MAQGYRVRVLLCFVALGLLFGAAGARADDYLSVELRAEVEALKAGVATEPTNARNLQQRAEVLWRWANAHAMNGGYVPVNLTAMIRPVSPGRVPPRYRLQLDGFVGELKLHDEQPDAIGPLVSDTGPFTARSWATLQQTYTVGSKSIQIGGGIAVPRHFMADYGLFQTTDPAAANYVSISTTNAGARFVVDSAPINGMHGGFRGSQPVLFFRLTAAALQPGDKVTVTYGGRADGGPGLLMPTISSDRMPFPLYLAFDEEQYLYSLPIQPVQVVGTSVAGVHGFGPSVVRPGEPFELSVRAEDKYYNRAIGPVPGWQVWANDQQIAELPPGSEAIQVLQNLRLADAGSYQITIRSTDGKIVGESNPMLVSADAQRVFWGDTHGHSGFAEGIGTPDRFMTWAKDDARLDFVTHSEHDIWMDDFEWEVLKENVAKYTEEGKFIAFLGYEWTTQNINGGHHNVLFRSPQERKRVATQFYPTLSDLYAGLRQHHKAEDVIVIPHAHQAGNYRLGDPKLQPLVEIMSQHGTFEWFGRMYLQQGQQVGFTAASDNHLSQPGYTAPKGSGLSQRGGLGAVLADSVSSDALFDAMKSLRAYATTGDRIILDVSLNGTGMGQRAEFAPQRELRGRVIGTAPISSIAVVKNDKIIWEKDYLTIEDGRFNAEETFVVSFSSASVPMHRGDNPRGWRPWRGTLEVTGAELLNAEPTDFFNADVQNFRIDPDNPNLVHFSTTSRGDASSLRIRLKGAGSRTQLKLALEPAREFGSGPPKYRPPAKLAEAQFSLKLKNLVDGVARHSLPFDIYEDQVTVRRQITEGEVDVEFDLTDSGDIQGDYYFVRVTQANDAIAWSSPIWVGGYPSR